MAYHGKNAFDPVDTEITPAIETQVLSKVKIGGETYWLKDADARRVVDTIYADYLKASDKEALETAIAAKVAQTDYNTKVAALEQADASMLAAINKEISDRESADQSLSDRIDAIVTSAVKVKSGEKIIALDGTTHELSSTLTIGYDSDTRKVQLKGISGTLVSEFDASAFVKDGMLYGETLITAEGTSAEVTIKAVTQTITGLTAGHKYLVLCFSNGEVTPTYTMEAIDVQDLVDVYTAGNGLELDGFEFSIKLASGNEGFLTVDENGLKLSGVQTAINAGVTAAEGYTDQEVAKEKGLREAADTALGGRIDSVEADIEGLDGRLTTAETNITSLDERLDVVEAKPAMGITAENISNWNDANSKKHTHSNQAVLDGITSEDVAAWDNEIGAMAKVNQEISDREAADDELEEAIIANTTAITALQNGKVDKVTGYSLMSDAEHSKLQDIAENAQVNVLEGVQLEGVDLVIDANKKVNITGLATDAEVTALGTRVTTAETNITNLQGTVNTINGADDVVGSFRKGDADTLASANAAIDSKVGGLSIKPGEGGHSHSLSVSGSIVPELTPTAKHLTATAAGTALDTVASDEFVKTVDTSKQYMAVAEYVNSVAAASTTINGVVATVGTGADAECLILTPQATTFDALGTVGKANAATGALSASSTGGAEVVTGLTGITKGTAVGQVSVKTQPTITLANTESTGGVVYLESVVGAATEATLTGTATGGTHDHIILGK